MAKRSPKPTPKSKPKPRSIRRSKKRSDHFVWFERARAIHEYNASLKQADAKSLKLFDLVAEQMQRQYRFNSVLYSIILGMAIVVLLASFGILLFPSRFSAILQSFSMIGIPIGLLTLILLLYRNPVVQSRHLLESVLKLNIIFISFIRRVQQSDLMMQSMYYENGSIELDKIYLLMQEFQGITDQTQQEINQANQP
ncbi:MAG: hypothetical protein ACOYZ6_12785 [Chloroflexota bacterium]